MMNSKQQIFTPTAFMKELIDQQDPFNSFVRVECYFIRTSALTRDYQDTSGWDDKPRRIREVYFKPVLVLAISDKAQKLDMTEFDNKYGEDWGIKFTVNKFCCLKTIHAVNVLTIDAEKQVSQSGFEFYPAKTVMYKSNIKMYDSIKEKYKDVSKFAFRKVETDTFDDEEATTEINYDEIEV